ncbi:solute carrier family 13 member 3-like [Carcharodon carcharias]|uniref:solute carrier family 13 member 3-like n=1 Tax=Carcharodon carcharias TaxID=13397 RepID=UPI001B7F2094|nr:solute carrier family 13 member 3-like [Carcharodon carcharias]
MTNILLRLWVLRRPLILILTPLVHLPVVFLLPPKEGRCLYIILIMATFWCTEALPLAITALLPISLFPLFGILPSSMTCPMYFVDTNAFFLGGLIMGVTIEDWKLHHRIALNLLRFLGVNPFMIILGLMLTASLLSMWLSNTATTTMMLPTATAILKQLQGDDDEKQQLGTTNTEEPQNNESAAEEINDNQETADERKNEVQELEIEGPAQPTERDMVYDKDFAKGILLSIPYAATIGGIATLTGTPPNLILDGQVKRAFPNLDDLNFVSWFLFAFPVFLVFLVLTWLWISILYGGLNLRSLKKKRKNKEAEARMKAAIRSEYAQLGPMTFAEVAVTIFFSLFVILLFTRDPKFVPGWAQGFQPKHITDAVVAITLIILMFVFPSRKPSFKWKTNPEEPITPNQPLLTWRKVQHKIPWNVILLMGGGFAIAKAIKESGLSNWIGTHLRPLESISPSIAVLIICLVIASFTEFSSNTASSVIFLPILAELAVRGKQHPLYLMVPGTVSCSFAFMLPVATAPNAIVFSTGHLRVKDMVKAGLMLNILGIILVNIAINTWGHLIFKFSTFPKWAGTYINNTNRAAMSVNLVLMTTSD